MLENVRLYEVVNAVNEILKDRFDSVSSKVDIIDIYILGEIVVGVLGKKGLDVCGIRRRLSVDKTNKCVLWGGITILKTHSKKISSLGKMCISSVEIGCMKSSTLKDIENAIECSENRVREQYEDSVKELKESLGRHGMSFSEFERLTYIYRKLTLETRYDMRVKGNV